MSGEYDMYGGERSGAYRILVGKPVGKRTRGRPSCRWEDNTKMHLQGIEWGLRLD
jgi:hypothetical protein